MPYKIAVFLVSLFVLLNLSCSNNPDASSVKTANETVALDTANFFSGTFSGITPCADCPGIEMTVHFKPDSIFIETLEYLERNTSFSDTGTWRINDKIISVSFPKHEAYFRINSDSAISMLDAEKKEIGGSLADKYILKRTNQQPKNIRNDH